MAKVPCLRVPEAIKTLTLRNVRPVIKDNKPNASCEDPIFIDVTGNCFTGKPHAGIIIGGYVIREVGAELPGESQMRY